MTYAANRTGPSAPALLALMVCLLACGSVPAAGDEHFTQQPETAVSVSQHVSPADPGPPRDAFHVLPDYKVERLFTVPREELGSWVAMALDDKGRILVADQGRKGLCRVTPAPLDGSGPTKVERLDLELPGVQGMLYAFDSLYIAANSKDDNALYRARDTDGDDQFDELVKLKSFTGPSGEHGPHALRLAPDGKSIYMIGGNHIDPPLEESEQSAAFLFDHSLPSNWDEDLLLPRIWDPNGHARGRMAPGGWIAQTDPEGKTWRLVSVGYRNAYDFDFNADGELFTYDSDMEWDMGMPWYRPTRAVHATDGSEFGWRSGSGVWPAYYVDSLPPKLEMGPGSPTGVTFGYGARLPAKYQKALFLCDWTFGTIWALHLEPDGSTYKATREEFLSRTPLAVTDMLVGTDGALYFIIGGRNTQSELYRVTYTGRESTAPVDSRDSRESDSRLLRRKLEQFHRRGAEGSDPQAAIDFVWPHLGSADRFIRYAARVALEFQPPKLWKERALTESDPQRLITATVALAHQADRSLQPRLLEALNNIAFDRLNEPQQLELLRAYQLAFIRMGRLSEPDVRETTARLDALYPAAGDLLNRELSALLVYLQSPTVVAKTMPMIDQESSPETQNLGDLLERNDIYGRPIEAMLANQPDAQRIHYAFVLREARAGWTFDMRRKYFAFLNEAAQRSGGRSFQGFLKSFDHDAYENLGEEERRLIDATNIRQPFVAPDLPKPEGPGREWTVDELVRLAESNLKHRNFQKGRRAYAAARCIVCHRFVGEGGGPGPDLTQLAGRYNIRDLAESILEPSKTISDQYRACTLQTTTGKAYTGRVLADTKDLLIMLVDPEDQTKVVEIPKHEIELQSPSSVSLMPADLLKPLNENEVLDLLAYLLSRGEADDPLFRK